MALFEIGKKAILCMFFKNLPTGINMSFALIFDINKDIIEINNDKNAKLLDQNLINLMFEAGWYVKKAKRHYIVLEMALSSLESRFLFISFF